MSENKDLEAMQTEYDQLCQQIKEMQHDMLYNNSGIKVPEEMIARKAYLGAQISGMSQISQEYCNRFVYAFKHTAQNILETFGDLETETA